MPDYQVAMKAIRTRFETQVESGLSLFVQFDNEAADKPDAVRPSELDPKTKMWCRFSIKSGDSNQTTVGKASTEQTVGVAFAQLFFMIGEGTQDINEMAVNIKNLFKRSTIDGVTYMTPSIIPVGRTNEQWQVNVQIPFRFHEVS